jgi:hypothetical protein
MKMKYQKINLLFSFTFINIFRKKKINKIFYFKKLIIFSIK